MKRIHNEDAFRKGDVVIVVELPSVSDNDNVENYDNSIEEEMESGQDLLLNSEYIVEKCNKDGVDFGFDHFSYPSYCFKLKKRRR